MCKGRSGILVLAGAVPVAESGPPTELEAATAAASDVGSLSNFRWWAPSFARNSHSLLLCNIAAVQPCDNADCLYRVLGKRCAMPEKR